MEKKSEGDPRLVSLLSSWSGPRAVYIPKSEQGYGFTLRHFIVYPPESTKEKFKGERYEENVSDGSFYKHTKLANLESMDTIFVKHVHEGSLAKQAGLNTGDRVLSVNNIPITGKSYSQVISLIQNSDKILKLEVLPQNEDILQMAYKQTGCSHSQDPYHSHSGSNISSGSSSGIHLRPQYSATAAVEKPNQDSSRERSHSIPSSEELIKSFEERNIQYSAEKPKKMKSSTSYTSGLSIYHDPWAQSEHKDPTQKVFKERRRDFEVRSKENNEAPPNKTYSFGLFYPTKSDDKTMSASDLYNLHRKTHDSVLQSNDSQENISKAMNSSNQTRVIPLENRYSREKTPSQELLSSGYSSLSSNSRHSFPDSSSVQSNQNVVSPFPQMRTFSSMASVTPERQRNKTRQYIPVVSSSSPVSQSSKMSASVDNLDSRSSTNYQSERNLRTRIYEQPNQGSAGRTFIVKIGDRHYEGGISPGHTASQASANSSMQVPSYGTAFALTRSPMSGQYEISPKEAPKVMQRKLQFESGSHTANQGQKPDRYKTEIKKITSHGKFSSVASRLQNFEKNEEPQPSKYRRMSQEKFQSPEPQPSPNHGQSNQSILHSPQQQYQESAPIRIYVSQGSVNAQSSPIVEIVPVYQNSGIVEQPSDGSSKSVIHVQGDNIDGRHNQEGERTEDGHGSKPVRKPSFLAAVNAPQKRYSVIQASQEDLASPESPPASNTSWMGSHTSVTSSTSYTPVSSGVTPTLSSDTRALTSTPIKDNSPTVVLRRKSEASPEDEAIKLQRRTSYLMATAKDRDSHKLSLDKSLSPNQSATEIHVEITPQKPSMKKLKSFFGEKTPRILEATERRLEVSERKHDPASPLQDVAKKGMLICKTDLTDGKKASDRSWKQVWVELRGHALFLSKEKKDQNVPHAFSFDDQPVSIKSCIVDIAYDYTKKKNVFRLKTFNGSEYLFQADDHETMMSWIDAIQHNNNPDADNGSISADLILRSRNQYEHGQPQLAHQVSTSTVKSSPQVPPKPSKHLSVKAIKSKIPHSPSTKRKKSEKEDGTKSKSSGLWKFKSFRKGQINSSMPGSSGDSEVTWMFGVPLECCIPSPNNDFVPMIVDLCTKIVEARGLEVTGVYRVPGNTAAVNMMQEELNKGIDNMNVDHEKWCDVNVISSLLKTFFRKLPEPLVTGELYQDFINSNRLANLQTRMLKLKRLLHKLPEHHFETFKHLAEHLNTVASYWHINKMDAKNLAIVFGPTLIKKKDDDMTSMVQDMSDQCRIVESVILHNDWFFSSWDRDSYVPVEEGREDDEAPTNPSVCKMSCDDDDSTVNPRDIVSSIVEAANRKLRNKSSDKSSEDLDASVTDGGFKERNIDLEIKKAKMKSQADITCRSSPNLTAMSRCSDEQIDTVQSRQSDSVSDRRMAKSQEILDPDWQFIEHKRSGPNLYAKMRHFSDESLDRNDEMEVSHDGMNRSFSVSQSTIDRLRIIEEEARALREKEEKRQRDFEKRKIERQRIEQDIQRTKKELEIEDSHSVEDLLSAGTVWHSTSELFNRIARGEASSVTSEYSNNSSSSDSRGGGPRYKLSGSSDISDSVSPGSDRREKSKRDSASGGKYFVIQSVGSRSNSRDKLSHGSSDSLATQFKRTHSGDRLLELPNSEKVRDSKVQKRRDENKPKSQGKEGLERRRRSKGSLSRSNSVRRGSLDSLIDLREKAENRRFSYESSDSEDGSDLLSDLTSTFDQKLQILVNPKYKLNGSSNRLNVSEPVSSSEKETNVPLGLPPQVPLAQAQCNKFGLCSSNDMLEKEYRDPSLHRSPKDAKIGIAYRFERNPSNSANLGNENSTSGNYPLMEPREPSAVSVVLPSMYASQSVRPKLSSANVYQPFSYNQKWDTRPASKWDGTEANDSTSKQGRELPKAIPHYGLSYERSTSFNKDMDFNSVFPTSNLQTNSKTLHDLRDADKPSSSTPRKSDRRNKRRHTVGGTTDLDHFKAIVSVIQPKEEVKRSAWEQLQPAVKDAPEGANRTMLSWLQNERIRGSTPDLSVNQE